MHGKKDNSSCDWNDADVWLWKSCMDNVKFQILKDHSYLTLIKVYCKLEYFNKFTK